jgi:TM2 domain-containing membrane protein YozV
MGKIILSDMEKLACPLEQAKILGILKPLEQLQIEQKQRLIICGVGIGFLCCLSGVLIYNFHQNKKNKQSNSY